MSANEAFNIASLKMVHDELLATIEQSALRLEQFAGDRTNGELLQNCIEGVRQIRGTLSLIQLKGVDLLADELLEHINDITLGDNPATDKKLELLTAAFFMLPRYLEFCLQTSRSMALLLIPHINELRQARKAPLLPESFYFNYEPLTISRTAQQTAPSQENLTALVRRLRHMYQAGLLKVLQGSQIKSSFGIMCRALERLESVCGATALGNLWWLANASLTSVSEENLRITKSRKMLFSSLDREIKRLQFEGAAVMNRQPDAALVKELLYLLTLSKSSTDKSKAVLSAYAVPSLSYSDKELAREMEFLRGPSVNTINSMAAVLTDELHSTKNILERAAQSGAETLSESPELVDTLKKIADILAIVGLVSPSNGLKQEIEKIQRWKTSGEAVNPSDLLSVADTLLYVESTIAGLGKSNLSDEKLAQINALSRDDVMANNQIAEAEKLVIDEIESGLAMVKRALSAFAESNYDKAHIANISATLDTVRGGMFVLGLPRAAKVIAGCMKFIDESLMDDEQQAAIQHMMDTFADAIISLEYYLDNLKVDKKADTDVLGIAEESLEALGYKV
ncbi:pilus assembly protein [Cellvibrio sp.]|uniref:pilus assembly protein n=1 Tax=Cellvibrio sp. TaxID=1965322 RepID=UPI0039647A4F